MKVEQNQIKYLAGIAMIAMGAEETEAQRRDLERIATYTETLGGIDTAGVPERTHPFGHAAAGGLGGLGGADGPGGSDGLNRLREDEVTNEDRTKEWMAAAPDSKGPYIRVPRTIEE